MALSELTTPKRINDHDHAREQNCASCGAPVMVVQSVHGAWSRKFDAHTSATGEFAIWETDDDDASVVLYRKLSQWTPDALAGETLHHAHDCTERLHVVRERNAQRDASMSASEWAAIRERTLEAVARSMGMTLAPAPDDASEFDGLVFDDDDAHALACDYASDDAGGGA